MVIFGTGHGIFTFLQYFICIVSKDDTSIDTGFVKQEPILTSNGKYLAFM